MNKKYVDISDLCIMDEDDLDLINYDNKGLFIYEDSLNE